MPYSTSFNLRRTEIVSGCLGETADLMEVEREITYRKRGRKTKQCHAPLPKKDALIQSFRRDMMRDERQGWRKGSMSPTVDAPTIRWRARDDRQIVGLSHKKLVKFLCINIKKSCFPWD